MCTGVRNNVPTNTKSNVLDSSEGEVLEQHGYALNRKEKIFSKGEGICSENR